MSVEGNAVGTSLASYLEGSSHPEDAVVGFFGG